MKIQKKYIVIAALVLALGTAVYINWQFAGPNSATKQLGEASYVNATVSSTSTNDEAVSAAALTKTQEDFFSSERTKRDSVQDKVIDEADEIFGSTSASEEQKTDAQKDVDKILKYYTVQQSIESIIKAKGFSESLCYISDEGVTVIVPKNELDKNSALVIDDAVTSHYDVDFNDISIVGA